jgi:4-amino-4-deoxy-L-arabinose transferase-like glycosyltransferase
MRFYFRILCLGDREVKQLLRKTGRSFPGSGFEEKRPMLEKEPAEGEGGEAVEAVEARGRYRKNSVKILVIAIVVFAAAVRLYKIHRYPVNIGAFEGIAGYAAIQIAEGDSEAKLAAWNRAKQAAGSTGIAWNPFLVYPMAGVYHLIGFDLSHIGIRIVPIIYGVLSVWLIYLLMAGMFGAAVGLSAAFLLSTFTWSITLSRVCNDFSATIFYSLLCFLIFSRAKRNILLHSLLGGLLGLGTYFYFPARMVPAIVFAAVVLRCICEWRYLKFAWLGLILTTLATI